MIASGREELTKRVGNNPALNIGIKLGPGYCVDFDFDGPNAEQDFASLMGGEGPETPTFQSGRGRHKLYAWDDRFSKLKSKFKIGDLEIRLGPGLQTAVPPSTADGVQRTWIIPLGPLASLPDHVIARLEQESRPRETLVRERPRTPEDDFSDHGPPWESILVGWTHLGAGDFKRPGKEDDGLSARVVKAQDGRELLHVFSDNAPLPLGNHSKFEALRLLTFRGDEEKASKAIRAEGYGTRRHLKSYTIPEVCGGSFPVVYLVDGVLVQGEPCIMAGSAKTLKTSLAADLALSLATGERFLGYIDAVPTRVALMSGESGMSTLQETIRRILQSKGLEPDDAQGMHVCPETIRMNKPEDVDAVARWLGHTGAKVLILDPTYLMMPGADAANLMIQGALMDDIKGLCQESGTTLILVHHIKKGVKSEFAPPQLGNIAWAGFQEFARQWILLGRREKFEPGTGEHKLWLSVGGSAGHSNLWSLDINEGVYPEPRYWDVYLNINERKAAPPTEDARAKVLAALAAGPDTVEGLRRILKIGHAKAVAAIDRLRLDGSIIDVLVNKKGRSFPGVAMK